MQNITANVILVEEHYEIVQKMSYATPKCMSGSISFVVNDWMNWQEALSHITQQDEVIYPAPPDEVF